MATNNEMPHRLAEVIKRETKGERIRWTGRPSPWRALLSSLGVWLFALPWTVFSLAMMGALASGFLLGKPVPPSLGVAGVLGVAVGVLFMVPFVAVGIGMLSIPFIALWSARNSVHLVTDKRLVTIRSGWRSTKVTTVWPAEILSMERRENRAGVGNLKIVLGSSRDSDGDRTTTSETLSGVNDVRRVEELLSGLRAQNRTA